MFTNIFRLCFLMIFSAATLCAQTPDTESAESAPEIPAPEVSESELVEMVGYLTALGGGLGSLSLDAAAVEVLADGFITGLDPAFDLDSYPESEMQAAFGEAQARAQAVQTEASELPAISDGALNKIGMVIVAQSGLLQLGFTADDADFIRKGFVVGAQASEMDPAIEAKMPAFQAFIEPRAEKAQAAMMAEQAAAEAAAQAAAMADFQEIADEWSVKDPMSVVFETTQGTVEIELMPSIAPLAVANFVGHVESGYYEGLTFHRVIPDFMIQGGDPQGTGAGGESIWGKPFPDEFSPEARFDTLGLLAMANAGPMTNGSQFFITTGKPNWLNDKHTIFGKVTSGYDVVMAIEGVETASADKPVETQEIIKAYVKE